jgi:hypothetical protein
MGGGSGVNWSAPGGSFHADVQNWSFVVLNSLAKVNKNKNEVITLNDSKSA